MLLKDIKTLMINGIKFSRTSNAIAVLKQYDSQNYGMMYYTPAFNQSGGHASSFSQSALYSTNPYINGQTKWYAVETHDSDKIMWVPENEIVEIKLTGGGN